MALLSFKAVNWSTVPSSPEEYSRELKGLETKLGAAQTAGARLDARWGRLRGHDVRTAREKRFAEVASDDTRRARYEDPPFTPVEHIPLTTAGFRKPKALPTGGGLAPYPSVARSLRA